MLRLGYFTVIDECRMGAYPQEKNQHMQGGLHESEVTFWTSGVVAFMGSLNVAFLLRLR